MGEDRDYIFENSLMEHKQLREGCQERIRALFQEVGDHYLQRGVATLDLHLLHDVHAFYTLTQDPFRVVHVQGYPGMSSEQEARVFARMMDSRLLLLIRISKEASIGNEHEATIARFPNFVQGIMIPYSSKVLEAKLAENVPALR